MGYRIEYDKGSKAYEVRKEHSLRFPVMVASCLVLFFLLTWVFWPEGVELLREMVIPGDNAVTTQAWDTMVDSLKSGASVSDAVTVFCREIIHGAEIPG